MSDDPRPHQTLAPLTDKELDELAAKAGVMGLSTQDVRRLLANYRRLRELMVEVEPCVSRALAPSGLLARLRAEVDRK